MEFIEVIEKIGNNSEELEKLLKLKKFDEVYQLLKKNGYAKSSEVLREEVKEFMKKGLVDMENAELSRVSGGRLKENINKATSLGMASLLILGASPMGSKANATGFRSNGVKAPVSTSIPVNSNREQRSPAKSPRIPLIQGDNVVKAIGAVAALVGVGVLGYGARELQDKIFKPEQKPNPEPKVETVIVEKEKLIDYEEFIEKHVGKCNESDRVKRKACAECIQEINNILDITGEKRLSDLTYGGFNVDQTTMNAEEIGHFLCHAITGYACGESAGKMNNFQNSHFLVCLRGLIVFEAFAKEFQDSEKHDKIKRCIEILMDWYKELEEYECDTEYEELKYVLELLLKFDKNENPHGCGEFYEKFNRMREVCDIAEKLHDALKRDGTFDSAVKSVKIVYNGGECTLDDAIVKNENFDKCNIKRVIVKLILGDPYDLDLNLANRQSYHHNDCIVFD